MKRHHLYSIASVIAACGFAGSAAASELVYQPVNPNFGGSPFNYQPLINQANAQNQFDDVDPFADAFDPIANFEDTVTSALLSSIAFDISNQILDPNGEGSGEFIIQNTQITFQQVGQNVEITIFDGATGASTDIVVPLPDPTP